MNPLMRRFSLFAMLALPTFVLLTACDKTPPTADDIAATERSSKQTKALQAGSLQMFAQGSEVLGENIAQATQLQIRIGQFLAEPTVETLTLAQEQWLLTHNNLRKFYFYRQLCLNSPQLFPNFGTLNHRIVTYPIQPGFMDTYGPYLYSGIVHDIGFPLTKESLHNQHGLTDLAEAVLGLHAIEFMLFNVGASRTVGDFIGQTTLDEVHKERGFETVDELPVNRRRSLLALQAEILVADLSALLSEWQAQTVESFYFRWMEANPDELNATIETSASNALSSIILELSAIKQAASESDVVSATLVQAGIEVQKDFIKQAIVSIHANLDLLTETKAEAVGPHLETAIAHFDPQPEASEQDAEATLWKDIYSAIKAANDAVLENK